MQQQPRPLSAVLVVFAGLAVGLVTGAFALLLLGPVFGLLVLVAVTGATASAAWTCSSTAVLRLVGGEARALTGPARLANLANRCRPRSASQPRISGSSRTRTPGYRTGPFQALDGAPPPAGAALA